MRTRNTLTNRSIPQNFTVEQAGSPPAGRTWVVIEGGVYDV
jgi:hypothetical protein